MVKQDFDAVSYVLGILSIVFGFMSPLAGFIFGVIGFRMAGKQKSEMAKKARGLNKIGIIISIVVFAMTVAVSWYVYKNPIAGI